MVLNQRYCYLIDFCFLRYHLKQKKDWQLSLSIQNFNYLYKTKSKVYISQTNVEDKKKYGHPTIKPLERIEQYIINSSQDNEIILDPFVGSGTTCVAAKRLGRKYIGFEINEKYYKIAKDRLQGWNQKGEMSLLDI